MSKWKIISKYIPEQKSVRIGNKWHQYENCKHASYMWKSLE